MRIRIKSLAGWSGILVLATVRLTADPDLRIADAAKHKDWSAVRSLLQQHASVNAAQDDGATALQWAVHWDDAETAGVLIQAGANVNAANDLGVTALSLACSNRNAAMVSKLLGAGADANATLPTGESALMTCARSGSADAVKALLSHQANPNAAERSHGQTALMWAVAQKHPDVARALIAGGADVNAHSAVIRELLIRDDPVASRGEPGSELLGLGETAETGGSTPLVFAARVGDLESAKVLVAAGARVNEPMPDGNSALVVAAHSGHGDVAAFLLDKDASANAAGGGYTALHAAILRGDRELVKALLAHGANPNARITKGTPMVRSSQDFVLPAYLTGATPYFLAAKFVETDVMRALAAAGADTRINTRDGTTPLMAAAGVGWRSGVTRLGVSNGSAAFQIPDDDLTLNAVKAALELGADVTAMNQAGDTALHGAASKGYIEAIRLLASHGANLEAQNKRGQTPLAVVLADPGSLAAYGRADPKGAISLLRELGAKEPPKVVAQAPKNLQILKAADVRGTMARFTGALGVQCDFCHAQDRSSDENPHKVTARNMMHLVDDINAKFPDGNLHVSCYTCHRGATKPATIANQ